MYIEVQTAEKKGNFDVITNQLLYQLSYAGKSFTINNLTHECSLQRTLK